MPTTEMPDFLRPSLFEAGYLDGPVCWLIDPIQAAGAVAYAEQTDTKLIACRTNADLTAAGFRRIETLVTFEIAIADLPMRGIPVGFEIRQAGTADIESCRSLAIAELRHNRFHADPGIDDTAADAMRAAWVENDIRGRADQVLLACQDGKIVGFNALMVRDDAVIIDLIAVSAKAQGQGIGKALVAAIGKAEDCRMIRVGTQAANGTSIAFYKSLGFHEIDRQDTWHWMPDQQVFK